MPLQYELSEQKFLSKSLGALNPHPPISVHQTTPVKEVIKCLRDNKIGCVTVLDDDGRLTGVFSERDVLIKIALEDKKILESPISGVMTKDPQTAHMTSTMAYALTMMSLGGYRHLPIIDDDVVVGMISVKNIVDFLAHSLANID